MKIYQRMAVTLWLSLSLLASGLSFAQSVPGSGRAGKLMQNLRCEDSMTSTFSYHWALSKFIIGS